MLSREVINVQVSFRVIFFDLYYKSLTDFSIYSAGWSSWQSSMSTQFLLFVWFLHGRCFQVGEAFWEMLLAEHGIDNTGVRSTCSSHNTLLIYICLPTYIDVQWQWPPTTRTRTLGPTMGQSDLLPGNPSNSCLLLTGWSLLWRNHWWIWWDHALRAAQCADRFRDGCVQCGAWVGWTASVSKNWFNCRFSFAVVLWVVCFVQIRSWRRNLVRAIIGRKDVSCHMRLRHKKSRRHFLSS